MGRQDTEPTMVGSSIALLQERFRQLQRVREKREEQQLLKLFSESEAPPPAAAATMRFEPGKLSESFHNPEMIFPRSSTPPQDALSLRLNSLSKPADFKAIFKTRRSSTNSPSGTDAAAITDTSPSFENSEVDTSLHL